MLFTACSFLCCLGYQSQELFGSIGTFDWWGALELDQLAVSRSGTLCGYAPKITFAHLLKNVTNERIVCANVKSQKLSCLMEFVCSSQN